MPVRSCVVTSAALLLAHQGGWDEVLLIGGPIVAIAALLAVAKRRVDRIAAQQAEQVRDVDAGDRVGSD